MGKPAARVGDLTAHGGFISGPGCLTVLIGDKPAATLGDAHVCPLSNGPQPHAGGVIMMGSTTVLIGGKPAARVGDSCPCVGAPNMINAPGCPTVLIGD